MKGYTKKSMLLQPDNNVTPSLNGSLPLPIGGSALERYIIPVSAPSRESLVRYKEDLLEYLIENAENNSPVCLANLAYTLEQQLKPLSYRYACDTSSVHELVYKLKRDALSANKAIGEKKGECNKIVFMFPGQGTQYVNMAKGLYENEQVFKDEIDSCVALANQHLDVDLFDVMYPRIEPSKHDINQTQWSQISIFIVEYALAKFLKHLGVDADACIGSSLGEYVAATLSGVFDLNDAIKVIIARGKLLQGLRPGAMLAVNAEPRVIAENLERHNCEVSIINSEDDIVVSGSVREIEALQAELEEQGVQVIKINILVAGHSRLMEEAAHQFEKIFENVAFNQPEKYFASNLTGEIADIAVTTPLYWFKQIRNTVQFAKGINTLSDLFNHRVTFIEIGPGKGLTYFVTKYRNSNNFKSIRTVNLLPSERSILSNTDENIVRKEDIKIRLWMYGIVQRINDSNLFDKAELLTDLPVDTWYEVKKDLKNESDVKILEEDCLEGEYQIGKILGDITCVEEISIHDDFFKIGGNSILALQACHRICSLLGYNIGIADLFKYKTAAGLFSHSITIDEQIVIPKSDERRAVLSFAQERLWFIQQYRGDANAYFIPWLYELAPNIDLEGMKYSLRRIVSRHEVLRSTIEQNEDQGHGVQIVHNDELLIEEIELHDPNDYKSLVKADIGQAFKLSDGYPIRVKFYKINGKKSSSSVPWDRLLLLVNVHHIAFDGWSIDIFQRELLSHYKAFIRDDNTFDLPLLEIQYKDYAVWQRSFVTGQVLEKQLKYWKERLSGYQPLSFPTDYRRPQEVDYRGANQYFEITKGISQDLRKLAQRHGTTLHSVLLSSVNVLLNKYTGQNDIVIGCPIANRHHRQTEGIIGLFVNTQAHRTILTKSQSYSELILEVHQDQIAAQLYQDLPIEKLVDIVGVDRDSSRHPIFQIVFSVQNFGSLSKHNDHTNTYFKALPLEDGNEGAKFDLTISIDDSGESLSGRINYATSLFRKDTIERLILHYKYLVSELVKAPQTPHSEILLLSPEEQNVGIFKWNQTARAYPKDKTIPTLFQEQVQRTPCNVAVRAGNDILSYFDLNGKANSLACLLIKKGIKQNDLVPVMIDHSAELIVALLATMKVGATCVPIDSTWPADRISLIINQICPTIFLVSNAAICEKPEVQNLAYVVNIKMLDIDPNNPNISIDPLGVFYMIYTSGSTGVPKGVLIPYRGILNRFHWMNEYFSIDTSTVVLQTTRYVFDSSIWQIFWPLINGGTTVLTPTEVVQNIPELIQAIFLHKAKLICLFPSLFFVLVEHLEGHIQLQNKLKPLRYIILGGEQANNRDVRRFNKMLPDITLVNIYGPTEASIGCTSYQVSGKEEGQIPIGKPIANSQIVLLNGDGQLVPQGVTGEIYISGDCLTLGYFKDPDLTRERFLPHAYIQGIRMYKTGDLARRLNDGNIEFLGRIDDQVKIRGYRIELNEIEQTLLQLAGIKQACVLTKEQRTATSVTKYLVGYYVKEDSSMPLTQSILVDQLNRLLPVYMVPDALVEMVVFPYTFNGKLDKRAFPDPKFEPSAEYVAPVNEKEQTIAEIWQEVLKLDRIGMTDDFFRIGGNSILAILLSNKMSRKLGQDIKVIDVFRSKNIRNLLQSVDALPSDISNVIWKF